MYITPSFTFALPPYCITSYSCSRILIIPSTVEIGDTVVEERNLKNIIYARASVSFFKIVILYKASIIDTCFIGFNTSSPADVYYAEKENKTEEE